MISGAGVVATLTYQEVTKSDPKRWNIDDALGVNRGTDEQHPLRVIHYGLLGSQYTGSSSHRESHGREGDALLMLYQLTSIFIVHDKNSCSFGRQCMLRLREHIPERGLSRGEGQ